MIRSAPITSTLCARARTRSGPLASASALTKPVQAAPTSIAPARSRRARAPTSGAAFGVSSSGVIVATRTRSTCGGVDARLRERRGAPPSPRGRRGARRERRCGARARRCAARSSPRRRRGARRSAPLPTTLSERGREPSTADPGGPPRPRRPARAACCVRSGMSAPGSASDRLAMSVSVAPDQPRQHPARADLDEVARAEDGSAASSVSRQRTGATSAPRGSLGMSPNGAAVTPEIHGRPRRRGCDRASAARKGSGPPAHRRRVEGTLDARRTERTPRPVASAATASSASGARQDDLAGGVVVGDRDERSLRASSRARGVVAEQREHAPSGWASAAACIEAAPRTGNAKPVDGSMAAGGGERGELAERVARVEVGRGRLAPLPQRDARAVDRRLREAGALVDALEWVVADQLARELQQVGPRRSTASRMPGTWLPWPGKRRARRHLTDH